MHQLLTQARHRLGKSQELQDAGAVLASCRALIRSLDPYCAVLTGAELRRSSGHEDNFGVGLELEDNPGVGPLRIMSVLPGGPAQKAGLLPGDVLLRIDGKALKDLPSTAVLLLLNRGTVRIDPAIELVSGPVEPTPSVTVQIAFQRAGVGEPRKATLERGEFRAESVLGVQRRDDNSWDYWIDRDRKIAQVRIGALTTGTVDELSGVLSHLQGAGLRGLLLDLRWCPGGLLKEAVDSAGLFLGECTIVTVRTRGQEDVPYKTGKEGKFTDFPILVLVNRETSGGGELIAAALQDHQRAVIAGRRTRGKASIQTVMPLAVSGCGMKLTSGVFVRPSGKNLHRFPDSKPADDWGVSPDPDRELRISPNLDAQLREQWQQQTLRPGWSREMLPLDDPMADPVRYEALRMLGELLK
jgi:carboxyl-terminal processing protease